MSETRATSAQHRNACHRSRLTGHSTPATHHVLTSGCGGERAAMRRGEAPAPCTTPRALGSLTAVVDSASPAAQPRDHAVICGGCTRRLDSVRKQHASHDGSVGRSIDRTACQSRERTFWGSEYVPHKQQQDHMDSSLLAFAITPARHRSSLVGTQW